VDNADVQQFPPLSRRHCSDYCCPSIQARRRHPLPWYEYCAKLPKTVEIKTVKNKIVSSAFHIRNHQINKQLKIWLDQQQTMKYEATPKYLGINWDRSLTFKHHIEQLKSEVSARESLVKRLAGTKWGASYRALRISALALVYAPAEYCAPVWCRSSHSHKADVVLNGAMRTITGCLKSTPVSYLPLLAGISPQNSDVTLHVWTYTPKLNMLIMYYSGS